MVSLSPGFHPALEEGRREQWKGEELTVPAGAEPGGEAPGGPAGGPGGGGPHSGVVPLPDDGGLIAEVTAQLLDALAAHRVRPIGLSVADGDGDGDDGIIIIILHNTTTTNSDYYYHHYYDHRPHEWMHVLSHIFHWTE